MSDLTQRLLNKRQKRPIHGFTVRGAIRDPTELPESFSAKDRFAYLRSVTTQEEEVETSARRFRDKSLYPVDSTHNIDFRKPFDWDAELADRVARNEKKTANYLQLLSLDVSSSSNKPLDSSDLLSSQEEGFERSNTKVPLTSSVSHESDFPHANTDKNLMRLKLLANTFSVKTNLNSLSPFDSSQETVSSPLHNAGVSSVIDSFKCKPGSESNISQASSFIHPQKSKRPLGQPPYSLGKATKNDRSTLEGKQEITLLNSDVNSNKVPNENGKVILTSPIKPIFPSPLEEIASSKDECAITRQSRASVIATGITGGAGSISQDIVRRVKSPETIESATSRKKHSSHDFYLDTQTQINQQLESETLNDTSPRISSPKTSPLTASALRDKVRHARNVKRVEVLHAQMAQAEADAAAEAMAAEEDALIAEADAAEAEDSAERTRHDEFKATLYDLLSPPSQALITLQELDEIEDLNLRHESYSLSEALVIGPNNGENDEIDNFMENEIEIESFKRYMGVIMSGSSSSNKGSEKGGSNESNLSEFASKIRSAADLLQSNLAPNERVSHMVENLPSQNELEDSIRKFLSVIERYITELESRYRCVLTKMKSLRLIGSSHQRALETRNRTVDLIRKTLKLRAKENESLKKQLDATRAEQPYASNDYPPQTGVEGRDLHALSARLKVAEDNASRSQRDLNLSSKLLTQLQETLAKTVVKLCSQESLLSVSEARVKKLSMQIDTLERLLASSTDSHEEPQLSKHTDTRRISNLQGYTNEKPITFERIIEFLTGYSRKSSMRTIMESSSSSLTCYLSMLNHPTSSGSLNELSKQNTHMKTGDPAGSQYSPTIADVASTDHKQRASAAFTEDCNAASSILPGSPVDLCTAASIVLKALGGAPSYQGGEKTTRGSDYSSVRGRIKMQQASTATLLGIQFGLTQTKTTHISHGNIVTGIADFKERFAMLLVAASQPLVRSKAAAFQQHLSKQIRSSVSGEIGGSAHAIVPVGNALSAPASNHTASTSHSRGSFTPSSVSTSRPSSGASSVGNHTQSKAPLPQLEGASSNVRDLSLPLSLLAAMLFECESLVSSMIQRDRKLDEAKSEIDGLKHRLRNEERIANEERSKYNVIARRMNEYEQGFNIARRATVRLKKKNDDLFEQMSNLEAKLKSEKDTLLAQLKAFTESSKEQKLIIEKLKLELGSTAKLSSVDRRSSLVFINNLITTMESGVKSVAELSVGAASGPSSTGSLEGGTAPLLEKELGGSTSSEVNALQPNDKQIIQALREEIDELERQLHQCNCQTEKIIDSKNQEVIRVKKEADNEVKKVKGDLNTQKKLFEEVSDEKTRLLTEIAEEQKLREDLEKLYSSSQCKLEEATSKVSCLEAKVSANDKYIELLKVSKSDSDLRAQDLEQRYQELKEVSDQKLYVLQLEKNVLELSITDNSSDKEATENLAAKLYSKVDDLMKDVADLTCQLDASKKQAQLTLEELKTEQLSRISEAEVSSQLMLKLNELEQGHSDKLEFVKKHYLKRISKCAWRVIKMYVKERKLRSKLERKQNSISALRLHIADLSKSADARRLEAAEAELARLKEEKRKQLNQISSAKRDTIE